MTDSIQAERNASQRTSLHSIVLATAGQVFFVILVLRGLGRVWWCQAADTALWISSPASEHTSQHPLDPYSFSHVCHGLIFYLCFLLLAPTLSIALRFSLCVALECVWEVFENTPLVISRYREATAALGYEGDSIVNSVADIGSCAIGFLIAAKLGWRYTVAFIALIELVMLAAIRDSLLLNIIMLCYPLDWIRQWQLSAA
ncbi:MAG: DUF2585 family protein [Planctomycetaceae bacterium]